MIKSSYLKTKHTMKMTKTVSKTIKSLKVLIITHPMSQKDFLALLALTRKKQMKETNIPNVI